MNKNVSKFVSSKNRSSGVAALLIVSAFALLLVIMIISLSILSIKEQKQAGDVDQANRAVLIAEQGIADAFSTLENNPNYRENSCSSNKASNQNKGWACRTITALPGSQEGFLKKDEGDLIRADKAAFENSDGTTTPVRYVTGLEILYCNQQDQDAGNICNPASANPFSTASPYPIYPPAVKSPAVLELSFVYWQAQGVNVDPSQGDNIVGSPESIKVKTFVIDPDMEDQSPLHTTNKLKSKCTGSLASGYYCRVDNINIANILDGGSPENYRVLLKIKARYNQSHYKITFKNSNLATSDKIVPVPAVSYTVDVTGRSGNVYRRILARRRIESAITDGIFDNALYSAKNICKNLILRSDYSLVNANTCE